jgi:hypothetical protein
MITNVIIAQLLIKTVFLLNIHIIIKSSAAKFQFTMKVTSAAAQFQFTMKVTSEFLCG